MHDPSTWASSPPEDLEGLLVVSGTGEELGRVVGIETDRWGVPKRLRFLEEPSGALRLVPLRYVRDVQAGAIHLAGPREGYHITRLGLPPAASRGLEGAREVPQDRRLAGELQPPDLVPPGVDGLRGLGDERQVR